MLASSRPRRDDVARYCLPCSKKTGRLVRRAAPVLEAGRAARAVRTKSKRAAKVTREKAAEAARYLVDGVDLRAAMLGAWALPVAREWRKRRLVEGDLGRGLIDRESGRVTQGGPDEATEIWTFMRVRGGHWLLSAIQQT